MTNTLYPFVPEVSIGTQPKVYEYLQSLEIGREYIIKLSPNSYYAVKNFLNNDKTIGNLASKGKGSKIYGLVVYHKNMRKPKLSIIERALERVKNEGLGECAKEKTSSYVLENSNSRLGAPRTNGQVRNRNIVRNPEILHKKREVETEPETGFFDVDKFYELYK